MPNQINKSKKIDSIFLFCIAASLRCVYIFTYGTWSSGDTKDYIDIAKNLVFNHAFAFSNSEGGLTYTAFRPVLYPGLIAAFWTGDDPPVYVVLALQVILGSVTVVLTYLIARKHFKRFIAICSAVSMALSPMTIHYTGVILTETLFTFLLVTACYFWGNGKSKAAGVFFGLSFLTRPIIFPLLILLPLISFLPFYKTSRRCFLTMTLVATIIASPWILRNSLLFGQLTLTQSSGYGTNLLYGSIDTPLYGDDIWSWIKKLPLTQDIKGLNEIEQDKRKARIALDRITENPFGWLKVRAKQFPKLFFDSGDSVLGARTRPISQAIKESDYLVVFIKFSFIAGCAFLFLLFAIGFARFVKNYPSLIHIYLLPMFFVLIHLPMWIESRYLLPVMPFVYIVAVYGAALLRKQLSYKLNFVKIDYKVRKSLSGSAISHAEVGRQ